MRDETRAVRKEAIRDAPARHDPDRDDSLRGYVMSHDMSFRGAMGAVDGRARRSGPPTVPAPPPEDCDDAPPSSLNPVQLFRRDGFGFAG